MSQICATCNKTVYQAEWVLAEGKYYHKSLCFKCTHCNKLLDKSNFSESGGKIYCKTDYDRLFRLKGYGHGNATDSFDVQPKNETTVVEQQPVQTFTQPVFEEAIELFPTNCPRCGKRAYANESKVFNGRDWHRTCFSCFFCKKSLVSGSYSEKNGLIFCPRCYESKYGVKGFGFGGATVLH
ncbi:LIM-type zinc finger-containing protein [Cavenderia fasciculata]|uniref:LIM-type zinc finger-containing protein n=1 Tax=Cavenderia fasciculata TaxID=261658 RepID=F4PYV5_CACFS|nr:LIM-type zinc finger-containing protein [Cavenderia fasciculata]EGG18984.1 LIM-type zinc finger-containing protein [Cavenderia fasciculata]|eukprot:XP_004357463.1 LIM-type zinc finger-containing protein [Cavenderia fasciculata]